MGDLTAVNSAAIQIKIRALMQIAGIHPTLPSPSYNVVTICSTFLTEHDTSGQIEHVGVAERSESWRLLGARAGSRYRSTISRHADGARCRPKFTGAVDSSISRLC
jgi:hypothetical protein